MTAHLLILYPIPKDAPEFDRAYREEHFPYAGPRLVGATGVKTHGCSTLSTEGPLEECVDTAESGGVAILIER